VVNASGAEEKISSEVVNLNLATYGADQDYGSRYVLVDNWEVTVKLCFI